MTNESVFCKIDREVNEEKVALDMYLDLERREGMQKITEKRDLKIKAVSKEEWIKEHLYWIRRFSVRKWELEDREQFGKQGYSTIKALQAGIDRYLETHTSTPSELENMTKEEIEKFVSEDLSFAGLILDEKVPLPPKN